MTLPSQYTTQFQAGLGLIEETKILLDLWKPGQNPTALHQAALESGRFPNMTARRVRNVVAEGFAPRYLVSQGTPAEHLNALKASLSSEELVQLFFLFTARAHAILRDFVSQVYWDRYTAGYSEIPPTEARAFVQRAIDNGRTKKRWSESTVRRVSAYLIGCCADFGLLSGRSRSIRKMQSFRICAKVAAYLAYELHCQGLGDQAVIAHPDWQMFGLLRSDVL